MKLNSIQDGPFWGCSRMGEGMEKGPPAYNLLYICCTFIKKDPKNIEITRDNP